MALRSTEGSDAWKRHCARTSRVAKRGRVAENEQQWEHVVEDAHTSGRPLFVTGPPGTGKSFVVDKCVRKCLREGGRVLYALPTAQQASRVRSKHLEADVDTCSGAFFLYKNAIEVMDCLQQYDLVAVDEISQLAQEDFERIIQMWEAADKVPALVFAGDFWQLPGVNPSRATDSPRWKVVHKFELYEMFRCKDEVLKQKLNVLRTSTPTKQQLNTITRWSQGLVRPQGANGMGLAAAVQKPPQHNHCHLHTQSRSLGERLVHLGPLRHAQTEGACFGACGLGSQRRKLRPGEKWVLWKVWCGRRVHTRLSKRADSYSQMLCQKYVFKGYSVI